ncbi:MAG: type II toxin-antitoxin system HipA family toxin YjjJ [Gammaproteobacteria bacterium]|nr:type II toxin-antitoxin system HipA family toxin YjjJ [Gammaproteobacteria bacterium]
MKSHTDAILRFLRRGPASGSAISRECGVSQPTVSRFLKQIEDRLLAIGNGRSRQYALKRAGADELPIYRVLEDGRAEKFATITAIEPAAFWVNYTYREAEFFEGLPWWMQDMRPRGFLGRINARHNTLGLHPDASYWSDDSLLEWLNRENSDPIGNLLIGRESYQRWLTAPSSTNVSWAQLPAMAKSALAGESVGSSAAGEQPKLTARLDGVETLVKFSPMLDQAAGVRWADGLYAEHLALKLLSEAHFDCSDSDTRIIEAQRFLVVKRFDRLPEGGRRGIISLESVLAQFVGNLDRPWPESAKSLASKQRILPETASMMTRLWCFGQLTANTDMHNGNLSFVLTGSGPLSMAPVYDMMPMALMPRPSGHIPEHFNLNPQWAFATRQDWQAAYPVAMQFWQQLAGTEEVSAEFRTLADGFVVALVPMERMISALA